jgi:membrane protein YdbS with pleckstrin-like domain
MIYEALREPLLQLLCVPHEPPQPPLGSPESIQIFRAEPRYLSLQLLLHFGSMGVALAFELLGWVLAPVPGGTAVFAMASALVVSVTAAVMLVRYFLVRLDYDMRFYVLTDRSLRIRRGAWTIEESTYTFANVQNLTLHQGPLERLLGLTHLQIDTAGGGPQKAAREGGEGLQHQGRLDGIDPETAVALRDRILKLVRSYGDAGLGDTPHAVAHPADKAHLNAAHHSVLRAIIGELREARRAVPRE